MQSTSSRLPSRVTVWLIAFPAMLPSLRHRQAGGRQAHFRQDGARQLGEHGDWCAANAGSISASSSPPAATAFASAVTPGAHFQMSSWHTYSEINIFGCPGHCSERQSWVVVTATGGTACPSAVGGTCWCQQQHNRQQQQVGPSGSQCLLLQQLPTKPAALRTHLASVEPLHCCMSPVGSLTGSPRASFPTLN